MHLCSFKHCPEIRLIAIRRAAIHLIFRATTWLTLLTCIQTRPSLRVPGDARSTYLTTASHLEGHLGSSRTSLHNARLETFAIGLVPIRTIPRLVCIHTSCPLADRLLTGPIYPLRPTSGHHRPCVAVLLSRFFHSLRRVPNSRSVRIRRVDEVLGSDLLWPANIRRRLELVLKSLSTLQNSRLPRAKRLAQLEPTL